MSTKKKTSKAHFWLVVLGLFLFIGIVTGGVYFLDNQGLISSSEEMSGERPDVDGTMPELADKETMVPPQGDHDDTGGELNSTAFLSVLQMVLQLGLVVVVITGFQWVYARLVNRLSSAPAN